MNYRAIYDRLILKAKSRNFEGYGENHHVLPRCLGGTNDPENLARLTPEEHFLAHLLLLRIYPNKPKLAVAMFMMALRPGSDITINNKVFGMIKRKASEAKTGKKHTEETKKLISLKKMGQPSANKGKKMSPEQKDKISKANKGNPSPNKGKSMTAEQRQLLSKLNTGKKQSEETIAKRALALKGRKCKSPSPETRAKIAAKLKGVKLGPESRARQAASLSYRLQCKKHKPEILGIWQAL